MKTRHVILAAPQRAQEKSRYRPALIVPARCCAYNPVRRELSLKCYENSRIYWTSDFIHFTQINLGADRSPPGERGRAASVRQFDQPASAQIGETAIQGDKPLTGL